MTPQRQLYGKGLRLQFPDPDHQLQSDDEKTATDSDRAVGGAVDKGGYEAEDLDGVASALVAVAEKVKRAPPKWSGDLRDHCGKLITVAWPSDAEGLLPLAGERTADKRIVGWVLQIAFKLVVRTVGATVSRRAVTVQIKKWVPCILIDRS